MFGKIERDRMIKFEINRKSTIIIVILMLILSMFPTMSTIGYDTQVDTWIRKPGYTNCTYGPPDFSQFQDEWYNLFDLNWVYCGPTALANCLWWLDCKVNNNSNSNYFLPDFCGKGSKHPDNVIPFINWTANWINTSKQFAADDRSGTSNKNMTKGIYEILNYTNMSNSLQLETEGMCDIGIWTELVNYTNITNHLADCDDVILLLGFYCYDHIGFGNRLGGHYVQVNGYNDSVPGLSFSDPFFNRARDGGFGWNTSYTELDEPNTNGSQNWTQNVSYDYYWVNESSTWLSGEGCEIIDYTSSSLNWTGQNWMNSSYADELPCVDPDEVRTVVEQAWFIGYRQGGAIEVNKTVWSGSAWVDSFDAPVGTTLTFNISIHNIGEDLAENLTVWDSHYDALQNYQVGSSWILYPNGTRLQIEPNWTSWESGSCNNAPHGHLGWYFDSYELVDFHYCTNMYIEYNLTVNCSNYSLNEVGVYVCNDTICDTDCIYNYTAYATDEVWIGQQFHDDISCIINYTENSTWLISEHVNRPCIDCECLDEDWVEYETEYDRWMPYNDTATGGWEWVYRYDNTDSNGTDALGLSYTIANKSSMNRSQSILRMRYNVTYWGDEESNDPCIGIIYSYWNDSHYDMVLYSWNNVMLLSKNGTHLENTNDTTIVTGLADAYNYWDQYWSCNDTGYPDNLSPFMQYGKGIWAKTIWNMDCNLLQTKAWNITSEAPFGLSPFEKSGWIHDDNLKQSRYDVTKGPPDTSDPLPIPNIAKIVTIEQAGVTYELFDDYLITGTHIDWSPPGVEPIVGTVYNVYCVAESNTKVEAECFGLVVWDPNDNSTMRWYADFDSIEVWKLNYSIDEQANATEISQRPIYVDTGIPLLYFNAFNHSLWIDEIGKWYTTCQDKYNSTLITHQQYADCTTCTYQNISKLMNMESRPFNDVFKECGIGLKMDNQNDTIYYHSSIITNITNKPYHNAMVIQIDVPTDGNCDLGDGAVMCIDIDNDLDWTEHDIAFVWYDNGGGDTYYTIYTGNTAWSDGISGQTGIQARFYANWSIDAYNWSAINYMLPALHRYSGHRTYRATIPTYYFQHAANDFLKVDETFGLHIMTIDAGVYGVPPGVSTPVWENWNASSCSPIACRESNGSDVWSTYLNLTTFDEIEQFYIYQNWSTDINGSQMEFWAHGRMGNESGELDNSYWNLNIIKTANTSLIIDTSKDNLVNYTFAICNTGDFPIHNVTVNDTFPPGVVYVSDNISGGTFNVWDNVYHFNLIAPLNTSNCTYFNVTVNFTAGCALNGTWVNNFANVSCDEVNTTTPTNISIKYGENLLPLIDWIYPSDGAGGVSITPTGLANISVHVSDADGDTMQFTMYTNKTITWNNNKVWGIGSYTISPNGTYTSNQTFNVSQRYNTKWRWGSTTYNWWINLTDYKAWTNESYTYTTETSRYDVISSGDVISTDLSWTWNNRQGVESYLGIYDVDASGDIISGDISLIWENRT